jgi:xylitol oxidase
MNKPESARGHVNWAGNIAYRSGRLAAPQSIAEAQEIVRAAPKLRALGSRHCFNDIADTGGVQLSLENFRGIVSIDKDKRRAVIEGGARYSDLCPLLHEQGWALHNLASLPHISVAGACATATHGSGAVGNLATAVTAIEFIDGRGDLVSLERGRDEAFEGAVVNLGALGVVTRMTLEIEPAFTVRQDLYQDLSVREVAANFDRVMGAGYSVSLFTDWNGDTVEQIWIKTRGDKFDRVPAFFGGRPAEKNLHPIGDLDAVHCTDQLGVAGSWYERLPHFKIGSVPASGEELQVEYFVPREHAVAAFEVLAREGERLSPLLMISEVRTIAADDLWMSPFYRQACVAFHFSFVKDWSALERLLPALEGWLAPFAPRPHWGKLFTMPAATVQSRYPRLADFRDLLATYDPEGKFRNGYVETYVFGR